MCETKHPNGCLNSLRYVSLGTTSLWQGTLAGNWDHYRGKRTDIFLPLCPLFSSCGDPPPPLLLLLWHYEALKKETFWNWCSVKFCYIDKNVVFFEGGVLKILIYLIIKYNKLSFQINFRLLWIILMAQIWPDKGNIYKRRTLIQRIWSSRQHFLSLQIHDAGCKYASRLEQRLSIAIQLSPISDSHFASSGSASRFCESVEAGTFRQNDTTTFSPRQRAPTAI